MQRLSDSIRQLEIMFREQKYLDKSSLNLAWVRNLLDTVVEINDSAEMAEQRRFDLYTKDGEDICE